MGVLIRKISVFPLNDTTQITVLNLFTFQVVPRWLSARRHCRFFQMIHASFFGTCPTFLTFHFQVFVSGDHVFSLDWHRGVGVQILAFHWQSPHQGQNLRYLESASLSLELIRRFEMEFLQYQNAQDDFFKVFHSLLTSKTGRAVWANWFSRLH